MTSFSVRRFSFLQVSKHLTRSVQWEIVPPYCREAFEGWVSGTRGRT